MGICTAGFERGTSGNALTSATNEGDATPMNNNQIAAGGTLAYDNTRAAVGSQSCKVATGVTAANNLVGWNESRPEIGSGFTDLYGRVYLYFASPAPATNFSLASFTNTGAQAAVLRTNFVNPNLFLRHQDSVSAFTQTTNPLPLDQWVRVEFRVFCSATVGLTEVKLFSPANSTSPIETSTSPANRNTGTLINRCGFGIVAIANIGPFWLDGILIGATSYPGPLIPGAAGSRLLVDVGA